MQENLIFLENADRLLDYINMIDAGGEWAAFGASHVAITWLQALGPLTDAQEAGRELDLILVPWQAPMRDPREAPCDASAFITGCRGQWPRAVIIYVTPLADFDQIRRSAFSRGADGVMRWQDLCEILPELLM